MSFLSSAGDTTQQTVSGAYAPATPALGQILTEATNIYNQGMPASGYVAPTQQTLTGIAQAEQMANLAQQQQMATLSGAYLNPFLSPMLQQFGQDVYGTVAQQFSGAGRTPTSPVAQQQVAAQVAAKALPYAFQAYGQERERQLGTARALPGLTQVGQTLEDYEAQRLQAPYQALTQYSNIINPVARGGQVQSTLPPAPNRLGMALGGAISAGSILSQGGIFGGGGSYGSLGTSVGGYDGGQFPITPSSFRTF